MKKTLIALAAVAVSGAAMAQVTLTGEVGFGFDSNSTALNVTTAGMAQTDGSVTISSTEDLGGGMKVVGSHTMNILGRQSSIATENTSLTVMGGFGTLSMGAVEAANGIIGLGAAGAPLRGLDDAVTLDGGTNLDLIQYTTPALIPGLTANVARGDSVGAPGAGKGALQITGFGVNYAAGPLTIAADTTSYNYVAAAAASQENNRTRLSASYDLGVATIGAGYQKKTYLLTGKPNKQTVFGAKVPMGAITFGAAMSSNKTNGVNTKGSDVGAAYSLSKRTTISFARSSAKVGTASSSSKTRLDLVHKF